MGDLYNAFAAIAAALTLVGGAYAIGKSNGYKQAAQDLNNERESRRFSEIYAPLMGFFTTCHITTSSYRGAPYLTQRLGNAWELLVKRKPLKAFAAVFDKRDSAVSGEVEYGGSFPLGQITEHLQGREKYADDALIGLVSRANRAQYEDRPDGNDLTAADLELFNHVCKQYEALSKRFVGA